MQLYHHPFSLDSQKVRLTLEEKGIDYTSYHMNPLTGKNMDAFFFRMNPSGKIPVLQNGSHIIYDTIEIIQYIQRIVETVSSGGNGTTLSSNVIEWMHKIQEWDSKYFTLCHIPVKYRLYVSKFLRRVIIARMAESPKLASDYHRKLKEAYDTDEKLKNVEVLGQNKDHLEKLLDEVEVELGETSYLAGEEFNLADVMLIPVLARLELLKLEDEYINSRPNLADYWAVVRQRPSYKKVIGRYFDGWRRRKRLLKTWCFICMRSLLRKY
ncbi:glutathione S-transferase TCHQD-like isoform X1 [Lycium barbarum]|uniref:glutathione S-transferase TCHQD-like isoform X1 n=2 Tax=Lycium barbarum TaxID=112863 RepID=UPI00293F08C7|nr:glutathione S-transferase TCHQD-like isoform X1 [Lycium barbarum]XP_060214689.1 glutathione S-transferase TCHQD-like isoform X1 [Lycium barbarum]